MQINSQCFEQVEMVEKNRDGSITFPAVLWFIGFIVYVEENPDKR